MDRVNAGGSSDPECDHVVDEEGRDPGRHRGDPTQIPRHERILASGGMGREAAPWRARASP